MHLLFLVLSGAVMVAALWFLPSDAYYQGALAFAFWLLAVSRVIQAEEHRRAP